MELSVGPVDAWCVNAEGKFTALGPFDATRGACPDSEAISLQGAVVFPGLIDSHLHLMYGGMKLVRPQLDNCTSAADVASLLSDWVLIHPVPAGGWLQGFGWDQNLFPGQALPTRADLDVAFPSTPVWLGRIDGHAAWANSEALRRVPPLPDKDPQGGRVERDPTTGEPTGIFSDTAMQLVDDSVPAPAYEERVAALHLALDLAARSGLTAIHDPGIDPADADLFKEAIDNGTFTLRSHAMWLAAPNDLGAASDPVDPPTPLYKGRLSVGAVKFFMDGALGSWGAAMLENYTDRPDQQGQLRWDEQEYRRNVSLWRASGYQIATHAIGDRANRIVLDVYSELCKAATMAVEVDTAVEAAGSVHPTVVREEDAAVPPPDLRLRIEHFQAGLPRSPMRSRWPPMFST